MRASLLLAGALALAAGAAQAQDDACQQFKWSVARERQAFAAPSLPTLKSGEALPDGSQAVRVNLGPEDGVAYPVAPARKPKSSPAYGAVLDTAPIATAGTYQVTLSGDAWIDVVQDGKVVRSSAFSGRGGLHRPPQERALPARGGAGHARDQRCGDALDHPRPAPGRITEFASRPPSLCSSPLAGEGDHRAASSAAAIFSTVAQLRAVPPVPRCRSITVAVRRE